MLFSAQPVVPPELVVPPGRFKSIASKPSTKMNNATISLLSNASPSPDTFDSPFNWSTAWLSSASATRSSPPTIEAQVYMTGASNLDASDLDMVDMVVTVASVVKRKPATGPGKIKKARVIKVRLFPLIYIFMSLKP